MGFSVPQTETANLIIALAQLVPKRIKLHNARTGKKPYLTNVMAPIATLTMSANLKASQMGSVSIDPAIS